MPSPMLVSQAQTSVLLPPSPLGGCWPEVLNSARSQGRFIDRSPCRTSHLYSIGYASERAGSWETESFWESQQVGLRCTPVAARPPAVCSPEATHTCPAPASLQTRLAGGLCAQLTSHPRPDILCLLYLCVLHRAPLVTEKMLNNIVFFQKQL